MVKILNCYLYAKKSYGTLSEGAIFFSANPVFLQGFRHLYIISSCSHFFNKTDLEQYLSLFLKQKIARNSDLKAI